MIDPVTQKWIRNRSDELAAANGCFFDEAAGQHVIDFATKYLKLYEGELAGEPLVPGDWQIDATMRMFGWKKPSERWNRPVRRFRRCGIFIPKKNGKSPSLAWWALYLLCADGEMGQKVYLCAKDGQQAREIAGKHAIEMATASADLMREFSINKTLMQINHEPSRSLLKPISSSDSKAQKAKEGLNGSCLIDECFVADTEISSPFGVTSIDKVRLGDKIYCATGIGTVVGVSRRYVTSLCEMEFSDGTSIRCTSRHPFFTERAWVEAGQLALGSLAFRQQDVQALQDCVSAASVEEQEWSHLCADRKVMERARVLLDCLRQESEEQSDETGVGSSQCVGDIETHWAQTADWRGQWQRNYEAAASVIERTWRGVGCRVANSNERQTKGRRSSDVLQGGPWQRVKANCHRSRRFVAQLPRSAGRRCQENGKTQQPRLVRLSCIECPRPVAVYNLHVTGHPSYFANGLLVHNCHVVDREFVNRISRAGISRSEPMHIEVSTAGNDPESYGKEMFDYGVRVAAGDVVDESYFFLCYAAPQDLTDEDLAKDPVKYGRMANPTWGRIVSEAEYLDDYNRSKRSLTELADFKMYRLNIWQASANPWLRMGDWKANQRTYTEAELLGRPCYAGLDLAKTRDTTALSLCFPEDDGTYKLLVYYWLPAARAQELSRDVQYQQWAADNWLTITPGNVVDYNYIRKQIIDLFLGPEKRFNLEKIGFDGTYAAQMMQRLAEEDGMDVETQELFPQSMLGFTGAMSAVERLVIDGKLHHDGNPVLNWQAGNTCAYRDANDNIRPMKDKKGSWRTIDGMVASIMALGMALKYAGQDSAPRVWVL